MARKGSKNRVDRGGSGRSTSVSATEAQNNFGRVLGHAAGGDVVYITRYEEPTAVVLSMERS